MNVCKLITSDPLQRSIGDGESSISLNEENVSRDHNNIRVVLGGGGFPNKHSNAEMQFNLKLTQVTIIMKR